MYVFAKIQRKDCSVQSIFLRKIEAGIFSVVFLCSRIVGACGFEFGHEAAEVDTSAIGIDIDIPELAAVMVIAMDDAFVF